MYDLRVVGSVNEGVACCDTAWNGPTLGDAGAGRNTGRVLRETLGGSLYISEFIQVFPDSRDESLYCVYPAFVVQMRA